MAALATLKRMARLTGWVALSAGAMVAATCGAMLSACGGSAKTIDAQAQDTRSPATVDTGQPFTLPDAPPALDAGTGEANRPVDADQADLSNVPCE